MGIKNLTAFLKKHCPEVLVYRSINDLADKTVAIDTSMLIYQVVLAMRGGDGDMVNKEGKLTSHLYGMFNKIIDLLSKHIKPVFVFDGIPCELKAELGLKRKEAKNKAKAQILNAMDDEEKIKLSKKTFSLKEEDVINAKILLDLLGIPYINALEEADVMCAYLSNQGIVDGVCTEDMDILTFGGLTIYRGLLGNNNIMEINLDAVLDGLKLTYEKFVSLCILLGCDYCKGIKLIGPVTAISYVKEYSDLEQIIDVTSTIKKHEMTKEHSDRLIKSRDYFITSIDKIIKPTIKWRKMNEKALLDFLVYKHSFSLITVIGKIAKYKQLQITHGFIKENITKYDFFNKNPILFIE